jgi:transglutaminase superfamily protein
VTFSTQAPDRKVVTTTTCGEMEKVDVLGRVVMLRKFSQRDTQMPMERKVWADEKGDVLVFEMDMGMGPFRILKTEKEIALADSEPVEIMTNTFLEPDRPIAKPRELKRAVYRIGNKDGSTPSLYEGEGQSVLGEEDGKLKVEVLAAGPAEGVEVFSLPVKVEGFEKYLAPAPFVESDDPLIIQFAREAVGDETNAAKAATRIENYVREKITKKNLNVGFASAAEVAKTREGDCTEHGVLCCAMARAVGLPARVATGLVYLPPEGGVEKQWKNGFFGYHMWTEVLVADGHWMPIDAAIGTYDATHLALAKSDLSSVSPGLDMTITMLKTLGSLTIEVVEP